MSHLLQVYAPPEKNVNYTPQRTMRDVITQITNAGIYNPFLIVDAAMESNVADVLDFFAGMLTGENKKAWTRTLQQFQSKRKNFATAQPGTEVPPGGASSSSAQVGQGSRGAFPQQHLSTGAAVVADRVGTLRTLLTNDDHEVAQYRDFDRKVELSWDERPAGAESG
jgi:hypothetical protein